MELFLLMTVTSSSPFLVHPITDSFSKAEATTRYRTRGGKPKNKMPSIPSFISTHKLS